MDNGGHIFDWLKWVFFLASILLKTTISTSKTGLAHHSTNKYESKTDFRVQKKMRVRGNISIFDTNEIKK